MQFLYIIKEIANKEGKLVKSFFNFFKDILRCAYIGICISAGVLLLVGLILPIIIGFDIFRIFDGAKNVLYFAGSLGLFLSAGFFMKRDGTRPLVYKDKWKKYFKKLNIGFVIMFVSLSIIIMGIIIQYNLEKRMFM